MLATAGMQKVSTCQQLHSLREELHSQNLKGYWPLGSRIACCEITVSDLRAHHRTPLSET